MVSSSMSKPALELETKNNLYDRCLRFKVGADVVVNRIADFLGPTSFVFARSGV